MGKRLCWYRRTPSNLSKRQNFQGRHPTFNELKKTRKTQ